VDLTECEKQITTDLEKAREECMGSLELWSIEARRTCEMLAECTGAELSGGDRMAFHDQWLRETDAQTTHMHLRARLLACSRARAAILT
jgi:hypothetical protein